MALSYSQLQLYRTCPKKYEFACIKKLSRPISAGESFGSSVHNTLKKWGELEMQTRGDVLANQMAMFAEAETPASPSLTVETLLELWHQSFIVEGYETRVEADHARSRGEQLMHQFYNWWQQVPRSVFAIEKGFKIPLNDLELSGRFDRIEETEEGLHVIDFKTGKPRTQDEVDADLQLSMYALAVQNEFKKPCSKLTLLFLGEDALIEMHTTRTEGQLSDATKQIQMITARIEEKDFHPTPSKEKCRCCPYKGVCLDSAV